MVLMKYLQVQGVMVAPAVVTAATFCLNIAANFVFIDLLGFTVRSVQSWNQACITRDDSNGANCLSATLAGHWLCAACCSQSDKLCLHMP